MHGADASDGEAALLRAITAGQVVGTACDNEPGAIVDGPASIRRREKQAEERVRLVHGGV